MFHLQRRQPIKLLLAALAVGTLQCQLSKGRLPRRWLLGTAVGHGCNAEGLLALPAGSSATLGEIPMGREVGRQPSFCAADGSSAMGCGELSSHRGNQAEARDSGALLDEDQQLGKQTEPQGDGCTWGWIPLRFPSTIHNCLEAL